MSFEFILFSVVNTFYCYLDQDWKSMSQKLQKIVSFEINIFILDRLE